VYQFNDVDHINLFNGNLIITIPLGQRYGVNGNLSYGLTLSYSGQTWDFEQNGSWSDGKPIITAYPNRRSNAGVGWLVSMGRLIATDDPTNYTHQNSDASTKLWIYESSDGHNHVLTPSDAPAQTHDGSFLRMQSVDSTHRTIEFPDGTVQTFTNYNPSG